jgi:hypothetical protein
VSTTTLSVIIAQLVGGNLGKTVGQLLAAPEMVNGLKEWLYRVPGTNSAGYGAAFLVASVVFVSACLVVSRWRIAKACE